MSLSLLILIGLGVAYAFLNGVHDSSSIVATMISSRAIQPRAALLLTAVAEFAGPFVFGIAVANTIGREIADAQFLNIQVIIAALLSAIIWNVLTWVLAIPSSSSHALIGGIIGAVVMGAGFKAILMAGVAKVLISLFISPILGFLTGYLFAQLVFLLSWKASPRINGVFRKLQIITSFGLALSHGSNDAPKSMGLITLGLLVSGQIDQFVVPGWVVLTGAGANCPGHCHGRMAAHPHIGIKILPHPSHSWFFRSGILCHRDPHSPHCLAAPPVPPRWSALPSWVWVLLSV